MINMNDKGDAVYLFIFFLVCFHAHIKMVSIYSILLQAFKTLLTNNADTIQATDSCLVRVGSPQLIVGSTQK